MSWFDKNKLFEKLIFFSWVLILFFCLFFLSFTSHAETVSNGDLPYNVFSNRGLNTCIPDEALEIAITKIEQTFRETYNQTDDISYICFTNDGIMSGVLYDIMVIPNPVIYTSVSDSFNYRTNSVIVQASGFQVFRVEVKTDLSVAWRTLNAGLDATLLGSSATSELNGGTFTPRYPFYMYGVDELVSPSGVVVFTNEDPIVPIVTGHATPPDIIDEPIFPTGHARPTQVPQLTINNYTWTTPPTPDFTTLEDSAESIYNYLFWLGSNLIGAIGNIVSNIQNVGIFLAQTLQYYLGLIIDAIKNSINTFYNNMVSLFEPIASAISYITEPLVLEEVESSLQNSDTYEFITVATSSFTTFKNFFDNINVPSTLSFHIPYTILSQSGYIDFDFGWYANIRNSVIPWIIGFLYAGFGLAVFRTIPSIIHGVSGILQKGG